MFDLLAEISLADPQTPIVAALVTAVLYLYKQGQKNREDTETTLRDEVGRLRAELEDIRNRLRKCYDDLHHCDVEREGLIVEIAALKGQSVDELKQGMALRQQPDEQN